MKDTDSKHKGLYRNDIALLNIKNMNIQYRKFDNGLEYTMCIGDFKLIKLNNGTKVKSIILAENKTAVEDAKDPEISTESTKEEFTRVFLEVTNYIQNELNRKNQE